jgi:membrane associated rhomboid family serine protease
MNFTEELKQVFNKPNNALVQLIVVNATVFVVLGILLVVATLSGFPEIYKAVERQFVMPPRFAEFIWRPWTILSYAFMHSFANFFHILFNMLIFYWFGRVFTEYLGSGRLFAVYILGALAGGASYLLLGNQIGAGAGLIGASASVYAVAVAIATQMPNYTFHLLFIGPVRIKYLVAVYIFLSFLGTIGPNAGGDLSHLGGALIGFVYTKSLQNGVDLGRWISLSRDWIVGLFRIRKIRVTYRGKSFEAEKPKSQYAKPQAKANTSEVTQAEIDKILDKISESGYDSLSKLEKEKLFNYSKK